MRNIFTTFIQKKSIVFFSLFTLFVSTIFPQRTFAALENFKNLFTPDSGVVGFEQGVFIKDEKEDGYKDGIIGFRFLINLQFTPFNGRSTLSEEEMKRKWDYVANDYTDAFVIRACVENNGCYVQRVPYSKYGVYQNNGIIAGIASDTINAKRVYGGIPDSLRPSYFEILWGGPAGVGINTAFRIWSLLLGDDGDLPGIHQKIYNPDGDSRYALTQRVPIDTTNIWNNDSDYKWKYFETSDTSKGTPDTIEKLKIPFGSKVSVNLFYCGGRIARDDTNNIDEEDGTLLSNVNGTDVVIFKTFCNSTPYYKIGKELKLSVPQTLTEIPTSASVAESFTQSGTSTATRKSSNLPECHILNGAGPGEGTIIGCIAQIIYFVMYRPMAWFTTMIGKIFDFFLGFSINDEAYRFGFVQSGWQTVRDFANIFFIIIMVYAGFSVALGFGKYSIKNVVASLIFSALIINFSLFITRLGVDMSNILTRVFYNQMTVDTTETAIGGYKPISVALISTFNPQKLMSADILSAEAPRAPERDGGSGSNDADINFDSSAATLTDKISDQSSFEFAAFFAVVSLASTLILFFVAKMFFSIAFIFIGRVVSLYIAMIFSPIAFLTMGRIPLIGSIPRLNWKDWFSNYQKDLYLPPVFLFFLYIIGNFLSFGFVSSLGIVQGTGFFEIAISVAIPMIIVYVLIGQAKKIAEKFASETAKSVTEKIEGAGKFVGGFAVGGAVGLGAGALAMGGRGIGAIASRIQKNSALGNSITQNLNKKGFAGSMARFANKTLTGAQENSFDLRDNKLFNTGLRELGKSFGMDIKTDNKVLGLMKLGKENTKGGYSAMQKKKDEELKKKVEKIETNFEDTDEGKEQAKAHYKKLQEREYIKDEKNRARERARKKQEEKNIIDKITNKQWSAADLEKAKKQLEELRKTNPAISLSERNIKAAAEANEKKNLKKVQEEIANLQARTLEDFKKEQKSLYGEVKDNKSLTQALRIRYAQNIANDPEQNTWDTLRATAMSLGGMMVGGPLGFAAAAGAIAYDIDKGIEQRKKAAEKYIKDSRKSFTVAEKEAEKLNEAVTIVNKELTDYINRTILEMQADPTKTPADIAAFESKYKKEIKDGYYDHESLEEYAHFSEAYKEQIIEIDSEITVLKEALKNAPNSDKKAAAKAVARAESRKKALESAYTRIENNRKEKEKEKNKPKP
jgi:hypothetical protein